MSIQRGSIRCFCRRATVAQMNIRHRSTLDGTVRRADSDLNPGDAIKAHTVLVVFLLRSVRAFAQTQTQTNCQVIANQINCTTTSPVVISPPPNYNVNVPQPAPVSPELINALAAKRAQEFAVAEDVRRVAVEKFEAELSGPDVWTNIGSGAQFHVRMTNDRIYLQFIPGPGSPVTHSSAECLPADGGGPARHTLTRLFRNASGRWDVIGGRRDAGK